MKSESNLARHIQAAATKGTWWSIAGSHELFGVPEGTHRPLGEVAPQYGTHMADADFQLYKAQWKQVIASRKPSQPQAAATTAATPAIQSPDGICIAGRNDGTRCPNRANAGYICGQHNARPGLDNVRPHPSIVPALSAIAANAAPATVVPAVVPVAATDPVLQALAGLSQQIGQFDARLVALEQPAVVVPEAPAEAPVEPAAEQPKQGVISGLLSRARSNV